MKILIATDVRILKKENKYYFYEAFGNIFKRYFENFGKINLICRKENIDEVSSNLIEVTNMIEQLIYIEKFSEMLKRSNISKINSTLKEIDLVIVRCPSIIGTIIFELAYRKKIKIFAENMCDAWDSFWTHSLSGKIIAPFMYYSNKRIFKKVNYALYVTKEYLQNKYPCSCYNINASNVNISIESENILNRRLDRIKNMNLENISIMTVANVDNRSKGQEYVIEAIKKLKETGINVKYYLVGGGKKDYLKKIAKKYKVEENILFFGECRHEKVLNLLEEVDIYIQPSLQEGLPRAVIEAMSRACPCLGARTAGIPELLEEKFIFDRKSALDINIKIQEILKKEILELAAKRNYTSSFQYENNLLNKKRKKFYENIKSRIKEQKI